MTDLALLDAIDQADLVRRGEVTATELVEAAISRIELLNPALNAVIFTSYEEALARAASPPSGRMGGIPYLLKNLVVGYPTPIGSIRPVGTSNALENRRRTQVRAEGRMGDGDPSQRIMYASSDRLPRPLDVIVESAVPTVQVWPLDRTNP